MSTGNCTCESTAVLESLPAPVANGLRRSVVPAPLPSLLRVRPAQKESQTQRQTPAPAKQPARTAIALLVGLLVVYHINGRALPEIDCIPAPYAAWSFVRTGSFDLRAYHYLDKYVGRPVKELPDGRLLSIKPPGSTLAALPFVAPFALFRSEPLSSGGMRGLGKLVGASYVAASALLLLLICRHLAPAATTLTMLLFALGSCLYSVAAQALWMHGPATFWICLTLYLLLVPSRSGRVRNGWAGVALGLALLTRPTTVFFAAASAAVLAWHRQWKELVKLAVPVVVGGLLLALYNTIQFGHPVSGGYHSEMWLWTCPLSLGITGLLVAPSRGLLVYSPALLLVPWGIGALFSKRSPVRGSQRDLIMAWFAAVVATVWLYANWYDWKGGWCFGPRFLCECLPILCLLFAFAYVRMSRPSSRRLAGVLVGLSILVHFVGVFGHHADWNRRHDHFDNGRSLFSFTDTQIAAHAQHLVERCLGSKRKT